MWYKYYKNNWNIPAKFINVFGYILHAIASQVQVLQIGKIEYLLGKILYLISVQIQLPQCESVGELLRQRVAMKTVVFGYQSGQRTIFEYVGQSGQSVVAYI